MSPFHGTIAIFPPSLCSCSSEECQNCVRIACVCTFNTRYFSVLLGISRDSRLQRCCGQPLLFNLVCQIRLKTQRAKQLANQSTQIAHAIHRRPRDDFGCSPSPDLTSSAPFPAQASKCLVLRLPSAKKPYTAQARHCRMRDVIEQSRSS